MLSPNNLHVYIQVQANLVRIEGMKVKNGKRERVGLRPVYNEEDFKREADELERLAKLIEYE